MKWDPQPILDTGCPWNVGGIDYALAVCNAVGIPFDLEPLDFNPFYHDYGMNSSEAKLTIGIWKISLVDLHGVHFKLAFYLVKVMGTYALVTRSRWKATYETMRTSSSFLMVRREYLRRGSSSLHFSRPIIVVIFLLFLSSPIPSHPTLHLFEHCTRLRHRKSILQCRKNDYTGSVSRQNVTVSRTTRFQTWYTSAKKPRS